MTMTDRGGDHEFVNVKWRKPAALLINGGTPQRQGSAGLRLQEIRLGEVDRHPHRRRPAGRPRLPDLSDDSLLLLAVATSRSTASGWSASASTPTIEVPFPLRYAAGKDPQIDKAVEVLTRQIGD